MKLQNFEEKNKNIKDRFLELKTKEPNSLKNRLKFSWSNWGFGVEELGVSLTGPEYAEKYIKTAKKIGIKPMTETTVLNLDKT